MQPVQLMVHRLISRPGAIPGLTTGVPRAPPAC